MRKELVIDALGMAILRRKPEKDTTILHSDTDHKADATDRRNTSLHEWSVLWRKERRVQRFWPVVRRCSLRDGHRSTGERSDSVSGG
jgi:hypothetical protein